MKKVITLILTLAAGASGAIYEGRNIDGKLFLGSLKGDGVIIPVRVTFDGKTVSVRDDKRFRTMMLASEVIDDPKRIDASDASGKNWIISLDNVE